LTNDIAVKLVVIFLRFGILIPLPEGWSLGMRVGYGLELPEFWYEGWKQEMGGGIQD